MKALLINHNVTDTTRYILHPADLGEDALSVLNYEKYEVVIINDLKCKTADIYSQIASIRRQIDDPIIVLSDNQDIDVRLQYLKIGADDILPRNVDLREIDARVSNITRRLHGFKNTIIKLEDIELDLSINHVYINGKSCRLHQQEATILKKLMFAKGQAFNYDSFFDTAGRTASVHISSINKKLSKLNHGYKYIHNAHNGNYYIKKKSFDFNFEVDKREKTINVFSHDISVSHKVYYFLQCLHNQKEYVGYEYMRHFLYKNKKEPKFNVIQRLHTIRDKVLAVTGGDLFLSFHVNKNNIRSRLLIKINPEANIKFLD
jgi:DNA-binding response OmpR family regulator